MTKAIELLRCKEALLPPYSHGFVAGREAGGALVGTPFSISWLEGRRNRAQATRRPRVAGDVERDEVRPGPDLLAVVVELVPACSLTVPAYFVPPTSSPRKQLGLLCFCSFVKLLILLKLSVSL